MIKAEAEREGWFSFSGPPYAVAEAVFDENDMEGCTLALYPEEVDPTADMADADESAADDWDSPETLAKLKTQARASRVQARAGGLRFDATLPPTLADRVLDHVELGMIP